MRYLIVFFVLVCSIAGADQFWVDGSACSLTQDITSTVSPSASASHVLPELPSSGTKFDKVQFIFFENPSSSIFNFEILLDGTQEISRLIPPGASFLLMNQEGWSVASRTIRVTNTSLELEASSTIKLGGK